MQMKTDNELRDQLLTRAADDEAFRALLLDDPRGAVKSIFGFDVPDSINVHVHEETGADFHLVIPSQDPMSSEDLESVVGGGWGEFSDGLETARIA